jgi:hypothetical protein
MALHRQASLERARLSLAQSTLVLAETDTIFTSSSPKNISFDSSAGLHQRLETDGLHMALAVGIAVMVVAL